MMTASINIEGLRVYARHGVGPQEAIVGNDFEIDAKLLMDCPKAVGSDELDDTVSYADIIAIIKAEMAERSLLLEHVAGRLKRAITSAYPAITGGSISVWKLCPPITAEPSRVGFTLNW